MTSEREFQSQFTKWAKHHVKQSAAFELKFIKGSTMPFGAIRPHQIENLLSARRRSLVFKIPDVGYDQKPFDCFCLSGCEAYLVVLFYEKRGDKTFYMIDIEEFVRYTEVANRKSLTKETAESMAVTIGTLA